MAHEHAPTNPKGFSDPSGTALQSAIAILGGSVCPDEEGEAAGRQWRVLESWAREKALILPLSFRPAEEGGREHDILKPEGQNRWYKFTKPWSAGYTVEVLDGELLMLPATPLQYLERCSICNEFFGEDIRLVGIAKPDSGCRLVISQLAVVGEVPTWDEVDSLFTELYGMRRLNLPNDVMLGGYESRGYFGDGLGVFDVRPINCVRDNIGSMIPIDVIPRWYEGSAARDLERLAR